MPDEDWVDVGYDVGEKRSKARFAWRVFEPRASPTGIDRGKPSDESKRERGTGDVENVDIVTKSIAGSYAVVTESPGKSDPTTSPAVDTTSVDGKSSKVTEDPGKIPPQVSSTVDTRLPEDDEDQGTDGPSVIKRPPTTKGDAQAKGIDTRTEIARRVKKTLYAPAAIAKESQFVTPAAGLPSDFDPNTQSKLPDVFSFRSVDTAFGTFGYVRIWTFDVDEPRTFLQEFLHILSVLPSQGLILDVRGNGGGSIIAGEAMLQVLTPGRITPESFHFLSTPLMEHLTRKLPDLEPWRESMKRAMATGDLYSQGFPLASSYWYNLAGQRYHGRVALIVDALCYSTTDIVAAGFQDHDIGVILGTSTQTGAGGANVWDLDDLRAALDPDPARFPTLPDKATFRVAVRRCTRVGPHSGDPLEDLGVAIPPENVYSMTRTDHVPKKPGDENKNKGLIEFAARKLVEAFDPEAVTALAAQPLQGPPAYVLNAEASQVPTSGAGKADGLQIRLCVTTRNFSRLDTLLDNRQWDTRNLPLDQTVTEYTLPPEAPAAGWIELRGFTSEGILVAAYKLPVGPRRPFKPAPS
jgi:hypothetical protein